MATEHDVPTRDESSDSGSDSGSDSEASDSGETQQVEWLATTRAKRSTAGNRMKSMLANEEPAADDDELELLFQDDGEDDGFTDAEKDDSDAHMDSSSDDEDADENAEEDAGEKELERQAREKRNAARKRKAQAAIPVKFRKKVRIEQPPTTASASPAPTPKPPRPKKKSERASWIPTAAEMPTRASERQTTRLSKEQLHQQMLEREVKRKKIMEAMERKAKKMEALKKPPLTQAQRLAEAAAVEKRNAKSLNRWEEAEKQREEERLRKIAALQNRKLDGPVVTFWSGIQELNGDQMNNLGKMVAIEEKAPRKKRQSLAAVQAAGEVPGENGSKPVTPVEGPTPTTEDGSHHDIQSTGTASGLQAPPPLNAAAAPAGATQLAVALSAPTSLQQPPSMAPPAPAPSDGPRFAPMPGFGPPVQQATVMQPSASSLIQQPVPQSQLQLPRGPMAPPPIPPPPTGGGFLAAPSMLGHPYGAPTQLGSQMPMMGMQAPHPQPMGLAAPGRSGLSAPSPLSMPQPQPQPHSQPQSTTQPIPALANRNTALGGMPAPQPNPAPALPTLQTQPLPSPLQSVQGNMTPNSPNTPADRTPAPSESGKVTRSCIILQNFDEHAIKDKQVQTQILFGRRMNKLASKFLSRAYPLVSLTKLTTSAEPANPPLCVITNHPARYRDPKTGLPYYNSYAFKEIQRLHRGDYKWSRLIGAWVGSGTLAARGVPGRFLDPSKPNEDAKVATPHTPAEAGQQDEQAGTETKVEGAAEPPVPVPVGEAISGPAPAVMTLGAG
jgi:vacuolar protein sorting-associated protein 72